MTCADRLLADRRFVTSHRRFIGSETSGPFGEVTRVIWREPSGHIVKTPAGPTSLAWAVAKASLEMDDEREAASAAKLARAATFVDEELRAAVGS